MSSSTATEAVSPDDECGVCGTTRENHGDMNHQFNLDGVLIPKEPSRATPRSLPPQMRGGIDPQMRAFLRLIEVLIAKGTLTGEDLLHVFGGDQPGVEIRGKDQE